MTEEQIPLASGKEMTNGLTSSGLTAARVGWGGAAFSNCGKQGYPLVALHALPIVGAFLVAEHRI